MTDTIYREDYRAPTHLIDKVYLEFDLDSESTAVTNTMTVFPNPDCATNHGDLLLNGEGLTLISVTVNGQPLSEADYDLTDTTLELHNIKDKSTICIVNRFSPAANTALSGIYVSGENLISQCEAQGFRHITYYMDRPDVLARFSVLIRASREQYPILLSNGNRIKENSLDDGRHEVVWEDPFPKPSYLFALVAGNLVCRREPFGLKDGRTANLEIWVEPQNLDKTEHTLESLKKAIRWDEERWGLELDLDGFAIVATNDFNFGAMENKGLNIFNARYALANPKVATDQDYFNIESVVGHEYFHNWTGDRVTLRDWFQLTLKEGLTVFRDQEFSSDMLGEDSARAVERIKCVKTLRSAQFTEDAGPMAHPIRPESYRKIDNFYTATVYEKGAEVVRMLQTLLGKKAFRQGFDNYIAKNDGHAVTCEDFIQAMANVGDFDSEQFRLWYSQSGTPRVNVRGHWDEQAHTYTLTAEQSTAPSQDQPVKKPFLIPFPVALLDRQGRALQVKLADDITPTSQTERMLMLTEQTQSWTFTDLPCHPVPSLNRSFAAPIIIDYKYTDEELALLAMHDTDAFNRWESLQTLMQRELITQTKARLQKFDAPINPVLVDAFRALIEDEQLSPAFKAVAMTLPSERNVGNAMPLIEPSAIHYAHDFVRTQLGNRLLSALEKLVDENQTPGEYNPCAEDSAKRSLKNTALYYMVATGNKHAILLVRDQFNIANNLTDRLAALTLLNDCLTQVKTDLNEATLKEWMNEPLLLNKWLTIQATAPSHPGEHSALDRVRTLISRKYFSLRNPNNVYALLCAFFNNNPSEFHRNDGEGYQFWVQTVLMLDPINPQVAARVARCLENWRRYSPGLANMMYQALKFLQDNNEHLSVSVNEIVDKALNNPA